MNELQIFNSEEFGEVRTVTIDNEPWFVGKDVALALGYMIQGAYMDFEAAKITSTGLAATAYTGSYDTPESVAAGIQVLKSYAEMIRESTVFQMPEDSEVQA